MLEVDILPPATVYTISLQVLTVDDEAWKLPSMVASGSVSWCRRVTADSNIFLLIRLTLSHFSWIYFILVC